jgi:uncharacterized glyoxalase superfamily protein PhnB
VYGVIPSIRVADLEEAVAFYVEKLGFEILRGVPADGNVSLGFGDARVMLEAAGDHYGAAYNAAIKARLGSLSPDALYLEAPELDAHYERVRAAGVTVVDPLAARPWGQSEFTIEDHAGAWLSFWSAERS